jgi:hypothetical protein
VIATIVLLALANGCVLAMWYRADRSLMMYHHAIENARMRGLRIPGVIEIVDEEIYPAQDAAAVTE